MVTIIAIDDHPIVLQGLKIMLEGQQDIKILKTFSNARDAVAYVKDHIVDVALIDLHMPEIDGIACTKSLLNIRPDIRIIALTMVNEMSVIKRMLDAGANGYLLKNAGGEELVRAIHAVNEGRHYLSDEVTGTVIGDFLGQSRKSKDGFVLPKLTRREKDVLRLILDEKTTAEIAEELSISFGTVETHRRNMLGKLGVKNTAGLVRVAMEYNLV